MFLTLKSGFNGLEYNEIKSNNFSTQQIDSSSFVSHVLCTECYDVRTCI
jgi:hypothetical protein